MQRILLIVIVAVAASLAVAQDQQYVDGRPKPRVFITDSKSWEMTSGAAGVDGTFGGGSRGGARPQTAEIIKTFGERCPQVIVNNRQEKADYVVLLDHEGGKGIILRDNKVAVFNRDGDSILSHSTRSLGNSVKDACDAITRDWTAGGAKRAAEQPGQNRGVTFSDNGVLPLGRRIPLGSRVAVSSEPAGADIEVDGSFVGNTPSSLALEPGEHMVVVKKAGYADWQRKIKVTGGSVTLTVQLEKIK